MSLKPVRTAKFITVLAAAALALVGCGGTGSTADSGAKEVTLYSADGLGDWYKSTFAAFTQETGIKVNYVEAGSGEVVSRLEKEKNNPQADLLVTLPPFIQQAKKQGTLQKNSVDTSQIAAADKDPEGQFVSLANNYFTMIRNNNLQPKPDSWQELLEAKYKQKIQYSTPGQAGDGTAMLILLQQLKGEQAALQYLKELQDNNVGPSSSTGKLGPLVAKGQLSVANSDLQMAMQSIQADKSAYQVFFPQDDKGVRTTLPVPYLMGLVNGAPHSENATKLMSYLLSPAVQQTLSASAFGLPTNTSVKPTDANYLALQAALKGVKIYQPDWNSVLSTMDATIKAYNNATGQ
ncbi:2-aminoethylphosphonate ABC transporter substrate-binding protein [Psychromicrobium lacuslunae]|uniref:Phosphonate ABC transporter substrate-binding protein n=1 Tax=Psychromicrobium lacuslunae TaxID=1618207 RepID=A0A0D4BZJ2_9MICC|nr:2-aminoethylphosphonate ABC transporter substrate-binding protein [Psychromicrobium lacuslunae]AJT41734.1 phosphonate ABC transporter substrate-binding protein [Psychromicrobium lacuslunae]